ADSVEGIKNAAKRKVKHELGIDIRHLPNEKLRHFGKIIYDAKNEPNPLSPYGEHELDHLLVLTIPEKELGSFTANKDETLGGSNQSPSLVKKSESSKQVLEDLVSKLPHINPTIPDRVSMTILENAGVRLEDNDPRLVRLMSLAGQKFISDLLVDAKTHHKLSQGQSSGLLGSSSQVQTNSGSAVPSSDTPGTTSSASPALASALQSPVKSGQSQTGSTTTPNKDKKNVAAMTSCTLTTDDVVAALKDRGINIPNIPYYQ
ncbi:isopentenyl-diphosphate delta-isomerase idi1, partial [Cichlidogyrus casuarinus]